MSVPTFQSENNVRYWQDCGSNRVDHWWHLSCNEVFNFKSSLIIQLVLSNIFCFFCPKKKLNLSQTFRIQRQPNESTFLYISAQLQKKSQDMFVINDPLGQTHCSTSSDTYFHVTFVLFWDILKSAARRSDKTCKIMITSVRDCGSAEWINHCYSRLFAQIDLSWEFCYEEFIFVTFVTALNPSCQISI